MVLQSATDEWMQLVPRWAALTSITPESIRVRLLQVRCSRCRPSSKSLHPATCRQSHPHSDSLPTMCGSRVPNAMMRCQACTCSSTTCAQSARCAGCPAGHCLHWRGLAAAGGAAAQQQACQCHGSLKVVSDCPGIDLLVAVLLGLHVQQHQVCCSLAAQQKTA